MFAFASLLLIPWLWFNWGINIAISYFLFVSFLAAPFIHWRAVFVVTIGLVTVWLLETHTLNTLAISHQHKSYSLTICADPLFTQYDDVLLGNAIVKAQPSTLRLRHVSAALPLKFELVNTPGLCIEGVFRVKQPFGSLLPNQFDVDRYYFSQQIDAKVTLVSLTKSYQQSSLMYRIYQSVADWFVVDVHRQLWAALVLGWSNGMNSELKTLLANNQLAHMFVVSGFHIGVIALFVNALLYGFAKLVAPICRVTLGLRFSAVLIVTSLYVWLIGWPIPALRALIMASVPLVCYMFRVRLHAYQSILVAALIVLLCFPETWLGIGNWLSFGSVLVIIMAYRWQLFAKLSIFQTLLVFQAVMSLLSLFWSYFYGLSFNFLGFVINLIASPVITFVIFPLALIISLIPNPFVDIFEWLISYSLALIERTSILGI